MPEDRHVIHHPELLAPIELPPLSEPKVIISLDEYRAYERFHERLGDLENAIEAGRIEGKILGYRAVLTHVQGSGMLGSHLVDTAGVAASIGRIIAAAETDLRNRMHGRMVEARIVIDPASPISTLETVEKALDEARPRLVEELATLRGEWHPTRGTRRRTPAGFDASEGRPAEQIIPHPPKAG